MYDELKKLIEETVKAQQKACGRSFPIPEVELEHPRDSRFGDLSTNIAMKIGKQQGKNPFTIAENLVKQLDFGPGQNDAKGMIERVEAVKPGFINFYLSEKYYQDELGRILSASKKFADLNIGKGEKAQVEFISANPTGPLTLANGRGGFSGDVLANVFKKSGYKVEKEYYVNDGGNQIKILNDSIYAKVTGNIAPDKKESLYLGDYIDKLAKDFSDKNDYIDDTRGIEDEIAKAGYDKLILGWIKNSVSKMGIEYDKWFSEKTMVERGEVDEAIKSLKKLTYEKDGALWLKTTEFGDDKDRVLVKQDGEKTYFANDIAYHWDKFHKRKFDRVVDIWGADHHGYVARMQAATEALGFGDKLNIVISQMVRLIKDGKEYKMSKRKGTYVTMNDLLELIGTEDAADVARYFFVSKSFDTHMDFDLSLAEDTSEKNPVYYAKYASARVNGILRNTKVDYSQPSLSLIKEPAEIDLIKKLTELPELIELVVSDKKYPVHKFTYYITEIAERFHKFYHECRVISDDEELTKARLALVSATKTVLEITGEDILGLKMPERM